MDLILRNARAFGAAQDQPVDIGIDKGRIVAVAPGLAADGPAIDLAGRLEAPGLVETHIHLDKTCIIDRCTAVEGTVAELAAGDDLRPDGLVVVVGVPVAADHQFR